MKFNITHSSFRRFGIIATSLIMLLSSMNTMAATSNAELSKVIGSFEATIADFEETLATLDWPSMAIKIKNLQSIGSEFVALSEADKSADWTHYPRGFLIHAGELEEAIEANNGAEAIYLVGTLRTHAGLIQASNPEWMREYYNEQLEILAKAIADKDVETAAEAAEQIHLGSIKLTSSAGLRKKAYSHTRWIKDTNMMARYGDDIIGSVESGDFESAKATLKKVTLGMKKWDKSFK